VQNIDWTSHSTMLHSSFSLCSLPAVLGLLWFCFVWPRFVSRFVG
jgi:hypothetical protein